MTVPIAERLRANVIEARKMVRSEGTREWIISIPTRGDYDDPDFVIVTALNAADEAAAALDLAQEALVTVRKHYMIGEHTERIVDKALAVLSGKQEK